MRVIHKGYATVEACFVMPLFFFFFYGMAMMAMLFVADAHIHQSLMEASVELAHNGYLINGIRRKEETKTDNATKILDLMQLNNRFRYYIGDDFFVDTMVVGGRNGVVLSVEEAKENPKKYKAVARYFIKIQVPFFRTFQLQRTNVAKQKIFVGYENGEEETDVYVYITPNEEVYHNSRACTHLSLSVNEYDYACKSGYKPCSFCAKNPKEVSDKIYVGRTTDLYHCDRQCLGLTRRVLRVKKQSVMGLPPCGRCGG